MQFLKILLFPFAILYDLITSIRNFLFDKGWKKSTSFQKPYTIVLGNLTVGGTGKTPHTEFLINHLKEKFKVVMLSRGYGRKTKGYHTAQSSSTAHEIGDEPLQIYNRFKRNIPVVVCEKRITGIEKIKQNLPKTEIIILDDAFQHRALNPDLKVLISRYDKPFYSDFLLPTGLLRENRKGAKRADIIIISKSPKNLSLQEKNEIKNKVQKYSNELAPIFFSSIGYNKPYSLFGAITISPQLPSILITSIANPKKMYDDIKDSFNIQKTLFLRDHQEYNEDIILKMKDEFSKIKEKKKVILTTEKDAAKLLHPNISKLIHNLPIYILPIHVYFHNQDSFLEYIESKIKTI